MDELARRFADLAEKYSPTVVDATLAAVRVEIFSSLLGRLGFSLYPALWSCWAVILGGM